jgi:hypothetical protein
MEKNPDPGWKKIQIQDLGSGMNIPDLIFENLNSLMRARDLSILDPGSGIRDRKNGFGILDPG